MKKYNLYFLVILLINLIPRGLNAQQLINQSGYYSLSVGDFEVIAISDGTVPVNSQMLFAHYSKVAALLKKEFLPNIVETSINTYLIKSGKQLILIDAGSGELFGSKYGGTLIKSLKRAGFNPEDISDVLITHIHLDHTGGLMSNGKMIFPNATIHINKKEVDFWKKHENPDRSDSRGIKENRQSYFNFKAYLDANKVKTFSSDTTLFSGISSYECAGHTAGHTVYSLESKGNKIVFWGDLVHISAVQFSGAEIPDEYDFDKVKAALQRKKAYLQAASEGYLVAADHISFPGIGHVRAEGNHYVWVPVNYSSGQ